MENRVKKIYPLYLACPSLILYGVFFILPLLAGVALSFTNWDITKAGIAFTGFENFKYLFTDDDFLISIRNTLIITFAVVILRNAFGLLLAFGLNARLKTRNLLRTFFYLPAILSYVVVGLMFTSLFQMRGMVNQFIGIFGAAGDIEWIGHPVRALWTVIILDVWKWTGFFMMIYIAGLQAIPHEYYEAARIDGAGRLKQIFHITIPMLMPAININVTLSLIGGLRVFEQVMILTGGGPGKSTMVLNFLIFKVFGTGMYGRATAMNLVLSAFVFLLASAVSSFFKKREVEL